MLHTTPLHIFSHLTPSLYLPSLSSTHHLLPALTSSHLPHHLIKQKTATFQVSAMLGQPQDVDPSLRTRKVIEHVVLFQMNDNLSEEQEKDMLDHLYTLQYQMRGIIALSLGRIANANTDGCTHSLFARFPSLQSLKAYYEHPTRLKTVTQYIQPYSHGLICVDYEAEVVDDIVPIFRRGEDFEEGVENVMLFKVKEDIGLDDVQDAFLSLNWLIKDLGSLVVQHTSGSNLGNLSKGYTHGMVTRFPSEEARSIFTQHASFIEIMDKKISQISKKVLSVDFVVEPAGATAL